MADLSLGPGQPCRYPSYSADMSETSQPHLDPEQLTRLRTLADRTGTPVETLVRTAIDDLLRRNDTDVKRLALRIAGKNGELYRRLAQ
ncbi:MAG: ribbon-helix-helix domain-containing protein [Planctomycetota bacterium]